MANSPCGADECVKKCRYETDSGTPCDPAKRAMSKKDKIKKSKAANDWSSVVTPVEDRIVVRPDANDEEQVSPGGIIISDAHKEKPTQGVVLACGAGAYQRGVKIPMLTKPGDRVLYGKHHGTPYKINGEEVIIIREGDVLCVLVDK